MGANAQTSVPTFTAGEVLTAANMNISARTGVPVFADTTARDAGFGGTGEKTLAEGQLCYLESTNVVQYYDGAVWATVGPTTVSSGMTLISSTTIGTTVSSVTVSNAFSSTYDNYMIVLAGGATSAGPTIALTLGATSANYYWANVRNSYSAPTSVTGDGANPGSSWAYAGGFGSSTGYNSRIILLSPNLADQTVMYYDSVEMGASAPRINGGGWLNDTTQYTAFTFTPSTGTMTGGTIRVYGFANS